MKRNIISTFKSYQQQRLNNFKNKIHYHQELKNHRKISVLTLLLRFNY